MTLNGFGLSIPARLLHTSKGALFPRMHLLSGLFPVLKTAKYSINLPNFILLPMTKPGHMLVHSYLCCFLNRSRLAEVWEVHFAHSTIPKQENLKGYPTRWNLRVKMTRWQAEQRQRGTGSLVTLSDWVKPVWSLLHIWTFQVHQPVNSLYCLSLFEGCSIYYNAENLIWYSRNEEYYLWKKQLSLE